MKRIFKYPVLIEDEFSIEMPYGSRPIAVQLQFGTPVVWAVVDDLQPPCLHEFRVIGTGNPIEESLNFWRHVGTFQTDGGGLVWHLFWHDEIADEEAAFS